ncbi:SDR family NAD(P)-dependent oxidoreductase [Rhizobium ruizarguesonis]|uniref:SDR family NAD(P)-dependent oxidoreductase n=1 Tax=Rhizobium ruizarguesonis TaxID=2081791 RepID=UPI00102F78EA|nr:SDR family NAD(P)-dependent oxidoreductase [Rhizobium ruizarguesonis]TAT96127.1 SDR family NAD(P)-dependent oxidoreductase [Rhizobium ruizarguesonis]
MNLDLQGKRALVTGSSSGLGEAIVHFLAKEGASVVVHGRDEKKVADVTSSVRALGGTVDPVLGDLSTDPGADDVCRNALVNGPVDILVNNAGYYGRAGWADTTEDEWLAAYNANVVSGVRMIKRLLPGMRERRWGRIIQIGGGLAQQPMATQPEYNATLAARHNLAVSLARDLKGTGVTSNIVSPGAIKVASVENFLAAASRRFGWGSEWSEIEAGACRDLVPNDINRLGRPDEIAAAVAYLVSQHADYISGAMIRVDGGLNRSLR